MSQLMGKVASTALGVIITVLLTNYLKPEGYGVYTAITVFVLLFGSLADWGLSLITVREAAKSENQAAQIIGNVLLIRLILSVLAMVAVNILVFFNPAVIGNLSMESGQISYLILVASLFLFALSIKGSFQIIFNVKLQMQNSAISDLTANLVILGLILWLIGRQAELSEILWAFNAGHFVAAGVAVLLGYRLLPLSYRWLKEKSGYILREAVPMGTILVLFTVYNRVDTLILAHYKSEDIVGYYGLAYRIYEVLVLGAAYFANSVLPILSGLAVSNRKRMAEVYKKSWIILISMGLLVAIINFSMAGFIPMVFKGFEGSIGALRILSLALVVSYLNHLNGFTIIALGKQWWSLRIAVVALAFNVILNLILIPHFSLYAAAFITFITEAFIMVLSLFVIHKEIGIRPRLEDYYLVIKELKEKRGRIFDFTSD